MNKLLIIPLILLLAACGGSTASIPVRTITDTVYPSLPPMSKPLPVNLSVMEYMMCEGKAYRCMDYNNFGTYLVNMRKLKEQLKLYEGRIDEVNGQRKEWKERNKK